MEVWFPEYGWVQFDPTPSGSGGIAAQQRNWLGPFRFVVDGLEHRWNKWILEYNLETQINVFRRAADAFTRTDQAGTRRPRLPIRALAPYVFGVFAIVVAVLMLLRRRGAATVSASAESGLYLRLRRAYHKAGYGDERQPPVAFLRTLERTRAPAHERAAELIQLYLARRFGDEDIGNDGRLRMRSALAAARTALRAER